MKVDNSLDILVKISPAVGNLVAKMQSDAKLKEFLLNYKDTKNNAVFLCNIAPILLGADYRQDIYTIVAGIKGVTVSKIKNQELTEFIKDLMNIWNNEGYRDFFTSILGVKK